MAEIAKVIDRIAADALAAPLKAAGYKKSGRTWRRYLEDSVQVIQVQASRHNAGPDGKFWLNAGVYFPAMARRFPVFPVTETPAESDCHLRYRPRAPQTKDGTDELLEWGRANGLVP